MIHFTFFIYCSVIPKDFDLGLAKQKLNVSTGQLTAILRSLRCGTVSQRGPSSHMLGSFPYNGLPLVFSFNERLCSVLTSDERRCHLASNG